MKAKLIKICDYIIESLILITVFLVALYFSFLYKDFSVFSLDKTVVFIVLTEVLLILSLIKLAIEKKVFVYVNKKHLLVILPFFTVIIIATVFSIDIHNSFRGSYWRQQGLFAHFHYLLFFVITAVNINSKEKVERIISAILLSSFFVSLYGILQWLGIDNFPWHKKVAVGGRVISTMGQPVLLGNYLLLVIFLTIYKIIVNKIFLKRFFFILLLIFQLLCLVFTYTRGSWLGFVFGVLMAVFLYFYIKQRDKKKIFINFFITLILLSLASAVFLSIISDNSRESFFVRRVKSITDFHFGSLALRLKYWTAGLDAFSKKSILGYGPENQHSVLASYYEPSWSIYETINTFPDRTHNEFLDLLLIGGILLLAAYLWILLFIFSKGIRFISRPGNNARLLVFFLLISIFSYQFSLLFSFSITETSVYFWLYLAIFLLILNNFNKEKLFDLSRIKRIYFVIFICFVFFSSCCFAYLIEQNINSIRADYYFKKARIGLSKGDYLEMIKNYNLAMRLNNNEKFYQWFFINDSLMSMSRINSEDYRRNILNYAKKILESDRNDHNNNYSSLMKQVKIYTMLARYEDEKYYYEAEETYFDLIRLSPYLPVTYQDLGTLYIYKGDYQKALIIYKAALSILPDLSNPYLNKEHKNEIHDFVIDIYQNIAYCYYKLDDFENQIEYYKKIIAVNPYRLDIYRKIAQAYYKTGDLDQVIWYNKRGYMLSPKDYSWPFAVAIIYKELGDKISALEYAGKALKLAPENKQILNFLEEVN